MSALLLSPAAHGEPVGLVRYVVMSEPTDRAQGTTRSIRRFASAGDADREDLAYWLRIPESERVVQVWRLSVDLWRLSGEKVHEPGLCRSVARVLRR
jgi:hypothetical protein